jgi:hypothetical protein
MRRACANIRSTSETLPFSPYGAFVYLSRRPLTIHFYGKDWGRDIERIPEVVSHETLHVVMEQLNERAASIGLDKIAWCIDVLGHTGGPLSWTTKGIYAKPSKE